MDRREKQKARIQVESKLEISLEMQQLIEEDKQYWNYRDVIPNQEGELPHWNSCRPQKMALFDWLPWGAKGNYREVEVLVARVWNHQDEFIQRLSEPQVQVLEQNEVEWSPTVRLPHPSCYKFEKRFERGLSLLQTNNMSSTYQTNGDSYQLGNYQGIVPTGPRYCDHNLCPPLTPPPQRESSSNGHA